MRAFVKQKPKPVFLHGVGRDVLCTELGARSLFMAFVAEKIA